MNPIPYDRPDMSAPLFFNGRYTTTDERVLGVEDRGFQYGDGVYEVIKYRNRRLLLVDEHLGRLAYSLGELQIPAPLDDARWREVLERLVQLGGVPDGTVYLQVTRGETPRTNHPPVGVSPTVVAYSRPLQPVSAQQRLRGVAAVTAPDLRWMRCDIKSVNLLGNVMARCLCRESAADEALLVRDGILREGAHSNLFAVVAGRVVTHPADRSILKGTVRGQVMKLAAAAGFPVEERPLPVSGLEQTQELFLTSTTWGVMPIRSLDGKPWPVGPVALRLGEMLEEFETS